MSLTSLPSHSFTMNFDNIILFISVMMKLNSFEESFLSDKFCVQGSNPLVAKIKNPVRYVSKFEIPVVGVLYKSINLYSDNCCIKSSKISENEVPIFPPYYIKNTIPVM